MQPMSASVTDRMVRAARLDIGFYEEVEHDATATGQAVWVVILAAVADGLGLALGELMGGRAGATALGGLLAGVLGAVLGWVVWSYVTYWVGTRLFHGTATPGEMLRTLGFAQSPRALNILGFIPVLGGLIRSAVFFWLLVAGIVAIRQALDFTTGRAIATAVIGWLAMLVVNLVAVALVALLGFGAGMLGY